MNRTNDIQNLPTIYDLPVISVLRISARLQANGELKKSSGSPKKYIAP